jgi:hypothetical protein
MADKQKRHFRLSIADDAARKMTRKEYYAARSYLRGVERKIAAEIRDESVTHSLYVDRFGARSETVTVRTAKNGGE